MEEWKEYRLGEIAEVQTGPFGSQLKNEQYIIGGTPVVTVEHINDFRIKDFNYPSVSAEDKVRLSKYIMNEGDILFTRVGSVDLSAFVTIKQKGWMFSSRMLRVRVKNQKCCNSKYLSYYFRQSSFREHILNISVGATMPSINTEILSGIRISLPSISKQLSISEVLSCLDDKIDLLNRQNATLEKMAETLFRQWFIEGAKEEWKEGKLGKYVTIKRGGSPRPIQDYLSDSGYKWLKISDVTNLSSPYVFEIKENIKKEGINKTVLLKAGSLVLSNSATPGVPKILSVDTCIHDGWLYFPESKLSKEFLYLLFLKIRPELLQLGNGSIFTNLKTDILKEFIINVPDEKYRRNFDFLIKPFFRKIYCNTVQLRTLTQLRDTLLPKLMSGEITVK